MKLEKQKTYRAANFKIRLYLNIPFYREEK